MKLISRHVKIFFCFLFIPITVGCKRQAENSVVTERRKTKESKALDFFNGPLKGSDETLYAETESEDIAVFHYTVTPLNADQGSAYVKKITERAWKILKLAQAEVKKGTMTERQAFRKFAPSDVAVEGPGLYVSGDAFLSRSYGNTLVVSCLKKGSKVALDFDLKYNAGLPSAVGQDYGPIFYEWQRGYALVIRGADALQDESTLALRLDSAESFKQLALQAPRLSQSACKPVKELVRGLAKYDFDPLKLLESRTGTAPQEAEAFGKAMAPYINSYLKIWPKEASFGEEIIRFGTPTSSSILACLYGMWKPGSLAGMLLSASDLPLESGTMCPYGKEFETAVNTIKLFTVKETEPGSLRYAAESLPEITAQFEKELKLLGPSRTQFTASLLRKSIIGNDSLFNLIFSEHNGELSRHPDFKALRDHIKKANFNTLMQLNKN